MIGSVSWYYYTFIFHFLFLGGIRCLVTGPAIQSTRKRQPPATTADVVDVFRQSTATADLDPIQPTTQSEIGKERVPTSATGSLEESPATATAGIYK